MMLLSRYFRDGVVWMDLGATWLIAGRSEQSRAAGVIHWMKVTSSSFTMSRNQGLTLNCIMGISDLDASSAVPLT
jgi:hypothetical protein